jgi:hypothetical protein
MHSMSGAELSHAVLTNPNNLLFDGVGRLLVSSFTLDHIVRIEPFARCSQPTLCGHRCAFDVQLLGGFSRLKCDACVRVPTWCVRCRG